MAGKKQYPRTRATMRREFPIDTTGMDPEMKRTMGGEVKRVAKVKALFGGFGRGKSTKKGK